MMLVFLLDCLRVGKLLKFYQTEGRISSNLLKRSKKASIVCRLKRQKKRHCLQTEKRHVLQMFLYLLNIIKTCCLEYIKIISIIYT